MNICINMLNTIIYNKNTVELIFPLRNNPLWWEAEEVQQSCLTENDRKRLVQTFLPTGGNYKVRRITTSNLDKPGCFQKGLGGGGGGLSGNYLRVLWPLLYQSVRYRKLAEPLSAAIHPELLHSYKIFFFLSVKHKRVTTLANWLPRQLLL